jgi:uncharacterized protein YvpB
MKISKIPKVGCCCLLLFLWLGIQPAVRAQSIDDEPELIEVSEERKSQRIPFDAQKTAKSIQDIVRMILSHILGWPFPDNSVLFPETPLVPLPPEPPSQEAAPDLPPAPPVLPPQPGSEAASSPWPLKPPPLKVGNGVIKLDVPPLFQFDKEVAYPLPGSACGPTALAMAIGYYTGKNPKHIARGLYDTCKVNSNGAGLHKLQNGAIEMGFPNAKQFGSVSETWVRKQLKAGKPILALVTNHWVLITGMDGGNVYFNDPGRGRVRRVLPKDQFWGWWQNGEKRQRQCITLE